MRTDKIKLENFEVKAITRQLGKEPCWCFSVGFDGCTKITVTGETNGKAEALVYFDQNYPVMAMKVPNLTHSLFFENHLPESGYHEKYHEAIYNDAHKPTIAYKQGCDGDYDNCGESTSNTKLVKNLKKEILGESFLKSSIEGCLQTLGIDVENSVIPEPFQTELQQRLAELLKVKLLPLLGEPNDELGYDSVMELYTKAIPSMVELVSGFILEKGLTDLKKVDAPGNLFNLGKKDTIRVMASGDSADENEQKLKMEQLDSEIQKALAAGKLPLLKVFSVDGGITPIACSLSGVHMDKDLSQLTEDEWKEVVVATIQRSSEVNPDMGVTVLSLLPQEENLVKGFFPMYFDPESRRLVRESLAESSSKERFSPEFIQKENLQ